MPPIVDTGFIIGHRGAAGLAPENTLAGLVRAKAAGCTWIEVDAKLTADGAVVLFHDDTLDRTTDATGPMAARDFAAVRRLDAGSWFAPRFKGERVPSLAETLSLAHTLGLGVNVEIKPCPGREAETADAVLDVLEGLLSPAVLISSFDRGAVAMAREAYPDHPCALLARAVDVGAALADALDFGCEGVHVPETAVTADLVAAARAAALAVRAFTVNCPVRAGELRGLGVDAVFSDYPDRITG